MMQVAALMSPRSHQSGFQRGLSQDAQGTPTQSRPDSPSELLDEMEQEMVRTVLSRTPRTSYAQSTLEPDVQNSHFHDMELCELMHSLDVPALPEVVKRAVRKAVKARVKKLGMKYDNEVCFLVLFNGTEFDFLLQSIRQYRKSFHDHDPRVHMEPNFVAGSEVGQLRNRFQNC